MKLTEIGEFGLIAELSKIISRASPHLLLGVGDDAAAWIPSPRGEVATIDLLIEGIHFSLKTATWYDIGWKAVAVNISDLAAMAAEPRYALFGIGLPPSTEVTDVEELYRGAAAVADMFRVIIAGGDTVRSPKPVVLSVTAFGAMRETGGRPLALRRDQARQGNIVAVTGTLGASAGGLESLRSPQALPPPAHEFLRTAHLRPLPRVEEARVLLANGVRAAMDISDGLVADLSKLCLASGVSAVIDPAKVPVNPVLSEVYPSRALAYALYGGEDYELLFSASDDVYAASNSELGRLGLTTATAVGEIVAGPAGKVWLLSAAGRRTEPVAGGYDAFLDSE